MTTSRYSNTIDTGATVNDILAAHPAAVSVFNAFGIDACCGGDAPLDEAARRDGADLTALTAALQEIVGRAGGTR